MVGRSPLGGEVGRIGGGPVADTYDESVLGGCTAGHDSSDSNQLVNRQRRKSTSVLSRIRSVE
jgi:hypothetical protein